ncbi:MAG: M20/M25/M40 family metallo-hydrolase [Ferruginibacter sp.]|nr:M20/M25/M40 family metallo-hydrolase [Ferruginibacter sp.]
MKKILLTIAAGFTSLLSFSQDIDKIINAAEVERIEKILSADDMQGRKTFTPGIDKAADFIASEFTKSKLGFWGNNNSYFQQINMVKAKTLELNGKLDTLTLTSLNTAVNTSLPDLHIHDMSSYKLIVVKKEDEFNKVVYPLTQSGTNAIVLIDSFHINRFKRINWVTGRDKFSSPGTQVFILTNITAPASFQMHSKSEISQSSLKNVVGVIPGKSKKDEYVIFSSHYDHLGIGKPDAKGDSIYNGANDDAAGTTAVMMLAKYFSEVKNNERTLIFVAFTAEEIGGYGSRYFSKQLNPDKVMAMFNIEMIGTTSKWGTNSAYITGYEKSDMGKILQANLTGSRFKFEPDPYPKQNLFYRSDNATLAELGVPAHTISTSKMEEAPNNEPNYHKQSDEISTLDMNNMAEIIKAIAISSKTIVSGKDTPTRVEKGKE